MDVLKIATAGSVDDGKSTLIGRLLYETDSLTSDKLEAIERSSRLKGYSYPDLSLATDGLIAEREQGITIDVAHIYFATENRRYIVADSPGHVEYTRNMITGASTAQASIVLLDARNGVLEQTTRHLFINNLLGIRQIIFAINKMDLVDYDEAVFNSILNRVRQLIVDQDMTGVEWKAIPLSALYGDGVKRKTENLSWYSGPTLLEAIENFSSRPETTKADMRFVVQTVIRPKTHNYKDFRGYAGKLTGANLNVGDGITVLPSLQTGTVKEILVDKESYDAAEPGSSCTVLLNENIDISRGCVLVKDQDEFRLSRKIIATVCWMDHIPLSSTKKYYLQQGSKLVQAKIARIQIVYDQQFQACVPESETLKLNEIGQLELSLSEAIVNDSFLRQPATGRFILIDPTTNNTVGMGLIKVGD